jgi:hypothetical protein
MEARSVEEGEWARRKPQVSLGSASVGLRQQIPAAWLLSCSAARLLGCLAKQRSGEAAKQPMEARSVEEGEWARRKPQVSLGSASVGLRQQIPAARLLGCSAARPVS